MTDDTAAERERRVVMVSRLFTADELRALLAAWEAARGDKSAYDYWPMHTYLAEAITEAEITPS